MTPQDTAKILIDIVSDLGKAQRALESFVKSEELPKAERDYQKAKALASVRMRADGKAVGDVTNELKGMVCDELFRRDSAEIKFTALKSKLKVLSDQLSGYQSVNKYLDVV